MITFRITLIVLGDGAPLSGFDLGDLEITTDSGIITSSGQRPSQSMMIFITLSELMTLMMALVDGQAETPTEFVATDSSFALIFNRQSNGQIQISQDGQNLWQGGGVTLVRALEEAITEFESSLKLPEPPVDGGLEDFLETTAQFRAFVSRLEAV